VREMPGQHNASKKLHAQFFLDQVPTVVITSSKFLIQRQREEEQKQIHEKIRKSLQLNNNNNDDDDNNSSHSSHSSRKNAMVSEVLGIKVPVRASSCDGQIQFESEKFQFRICSFAEMKMRTLEEVKREMKMIGEESFKKLERDFCDYDDGRDEGKKRGSKMSTIELSAIETDADVLKRVEEDDEYGEGNLHSKRIFEEHFGDIQDAIRWHSLNPVDYPCAVICVCSASEPEPQNQLELMLRETMQNMPCFVKQRADVDIARHFVVLQDAKETGIDGDTNVNDLQEDCVEIFRARNEQHEKALLDVKRKFSEQRVSALTINFQNEEYEKIVLNAFFRRIIERVIAPHMERLLYGLNSMIFNTRKGFKNQFKSFWGRNVVGTTTTSNTTVPIPSSTLSSGAISSSLHARDGSESPNLTVSKQDVYSSQESQIRRAGDLSLFLGDIDNAISSYKLIGADYKAEKNWKSCGLAYEAIGIALTRKADELVAGRAHTTSPMKISNSNSNLATTASDDALRKEADVAFEYAISCFAKVKKQRDDHLAMANLAAEAIIDIEAFNYIDEMLVLCSIRRATLLVSGGRFREAAATFAKEAANYGGVNDLQSALLLERASRNYLDVDFSRTFTRKVPKSLPWLRKHAFHAALAGHGYARINARRAAARCYALSLASLGYENTWHKCREHCLFSLARLAAHDGNNEDAVQYFQRLLGEENGFGNSDRIHASRTETTQRTYLREYLHVVSCYLREVNNNNNNNNNNINKNVVKNRKSSASVIASPLPEVDIGAVFVSFANDSKGDVDEKNASTASGHHNTSFSSPGSKYTQQQKQQFSNSPGTLERQLSNGFGTFNHQLRSKIAFGDVSWKSIEEKSGIVPILQGNNNASSNWLDGNSNASKEQRSVTAKGEIVSVSAKVSNPLKIPLTLNNVCLEWTFDDDDDLKSSAATCETIETLEMQPNEKSEITLHITPNRPGVLRVVGIKWTLENIAIGSATFDIRAPLSRRDTAKEKETKIRKIWVKDIPEDSRLVFDVVDTVPRLEASFEISESNQDVLDGSIDKVIVVIKNVSDATARHVHIRLPSNAFTPFDDSGLKLETSSSRYGNVYSVRDSIRPKEHVCLSCWFHPTRLSAKEFEALDAQILSAADSRNNTNTTNVIFGDDEDKHLNSTNVFSQEARVMLCYQPEPPAPKLLRYRLTKLSKSYVTKRSILLSIKIMPSIGAADEVVCTLKAINCSNTQTFELTSIVAALRTKTTNSSDCDANNVEFLKTKKLFANCFKGDGKLLRPGKSLDATFKVSRNVLNERENTVLLLDNDSKEDADMENIARKLCASSSTLEKICVSLQWKTIYNTGGGGGGGVVERGSSRCCFVRNNPTKENENGSDTRTTNDTDIHHNVLAVASVDNEKFPNGMVSFLAVKNDDDDDVSQFLRIVPVFISVFNGTNETIDVAFEAAISAHNEETHEKIKIKNKKEASSWMWIRETRKTFKRVQAKQTLVIECALLVLRPGAFVVDDFEISFVTSSDQKQQQRQQQQQRNEEKEGEEDRGRTRASAVVVPCTPLLLFAH
jgi:tetratricopeptide (TPR) repeat protein